MKNFVKKWSASGKARVTPLAGALLAMLFVSACVHRVSLTCERDPATGIVVCAADGAAG